MILLDTDFMVALFRKKAAALEKLDKIKNTQLAISSITILEIEAGFQKINKTLNLQDFVQNYFLISFDLNEAKATAKIQVELEKHGSKIGVEDEMIAGTALANDATLLTRNTKHFSRIKGLKLDSW